MVMLGCLFFNAVHTINHLLLHMQHHVTMSVCCAHSSIAFRSYTVQSCEQYLCILICMMFVMYALHARRIHGMDSGGYEGATSATPSIIVRTHSCRITHAMTGSTSQHNSLASTQYRAHYGRLIAWHKKLLRMAMFVIEDEVM